MVLQAAAAHTGTAADGTADTLKQVSELDYIGGDSVRLRDLAAILRLADELSEGPQRTSAFLLEKGRYMPPAAQYHEYAAMTHIRPDRGTGRIMVTYEVVLTDVGVEPGSFAVDPLRELLQFAYDRAVKLDQERRYARFYCPVLSPFNTTAIAFNFHHGARLLELNLPPLILNDKVVPGSTAVPIPERDPNYALDKLIPCLLTLAKETHP